MDQLKEALDFVKEILSKNKIKSKSKTKSPNRGLLSCSNIRRFGTIEINLKSNYGRDWSKTMYFHICHNITNGRYYVNVTGEQPSDKIVDCFELNKLLLLESVARFFGLNITLTLGEDKCPTQ